MLSLLIYYYHHHPLEHWPARKNLCIDGNIDNMQLFFRESHQDKNNEAPLVCRQCLDENQLLLEENRFHRKQGKLDETIVLFKNYIDDRHSIGDLKTISSMNVSLIAC